MLGIHGPRQCRRKIKVDQQQDEGDCFHGLVDEFHELIKHRLALTEQVPRYRLRQVAILFKTESGGVANRDA